jgi:GLPGLI family protein
MRNLLTILVILLNIFSYKQNNEVKIYYIASLNNKELIDRISNSSLFIEEARKRRIKKEQSKEPVAFTLLLGQNEGIFKIDSTKKSNRFNPTLLASRSDRIYYSNILNKEQFWISDRITPGAFIHLEKINWELTSETKRIGDYLCYKATAVMPKEQPSGNEYLEPVVAWYTNEIPITIGVLGFHGLPGLTMELTYNLKLNGRVTFQMEKIEFENKKTKILKPKGTRNMSEGEYVKLINRLNEERIKRRQTQNH